MSAALASAPAPIEVARVRRKLEQVRELVAEARVLLVELYEARAWVTLGLASWQALCEQELPELGELLSLAQREALVVELGNSGLSLRAAGAVVDVAPNTARAWMRKAGVQRERSRGLDGISRPASSTAPRVARHRPLVDRVVQLLGQHPEGLSVLDVVERLRVRQSQASPALCRLAAAGRVDYLAPAKRGQVGRYVTRGES